MNNLNLRLVANVDWDRAKIGEIVQISRLKRRLLAYFEAEHFGDLQAKFSDRIEISYDRTSKNLVRFRSCYCGTYERFGGLDVTVSVETLMTHILYDSDYLFKYERPEALVAFLKSVITDRPKKKRVR